MTKSVIVPSILYTAAVISIEVSFRSASVYASPPQYRQIVLSGDAAPGTGFEFGTAFWGELNESGTLSFYADLPGAPAGSERGYWVYQGTSLTLAVREGQTFTTASGLLKIDSLYYVRLNNHGSLMIDAICTDVATSRRLLVSQGNDLTQIASIGDPAPGAGGTFTEFRTPMFDDLVNITFAARTSTGKRGIWSGNPSAVTSIGYAGGPAPDTAGEIFTSSEFMDGNFGILNPASVTSSGMIAMPADASTLPLRPTSTRAGLWLGLPDNLKLLFRGGDQVPGQDPGITFSRFAFQHSDNGYNADGGVSVNNHGDVAFVAETSARIGGGFGSVWLYRQGMLSEIAKYGQDAPDSPAGTILGSLTTPVMNDLGELVFSSVVGLPGVYDDATRYAIWHSGGDRLRLLARAGDVAPGAAPDGRFPGGTALFRTRPSLNNLGRIAFSATLTNDESGIWVTDDLGQLYPLIMTGELLEVQTSIGVEERAVRQIYWFDLNDRNELFAQLYFTDGSGGMFVFQVPEPSGAIVLGVCLLTMSRGRNLRARPQQ